MLNVLYLFWVNIYIYILPKHIGGGGGWKVNMLNVMFHISCGGGGGVWGGEEGGGGGYMLNVLFFFSANILS